MGHTDSLVNLIVLSELLILFLTYIYFKAIAQLNLTLSIVESNWAVIGRE